MNVEPTMLERLGSEPLLHDLKHCCICSVSPPFSTKERPTILYQGTCLLWVPLGEQMHAALGPLPVGGSAQLTAPRREIVTIEHDTPLSSMVHIHRIGWSCFAYDVVLMPLNNT